MPTLQSQIDDYIAGFKTRAPAEVQALMAEATEQLRSSGIAARALQVGDPAPDRVLSDAQGRPQRLSERWRQGGLVLVFYRGGWCPYCNFTLRAWAEQLTAVKAQGLQLVAVSPQSPDASLSTAEKHDLPYPVLSDADFALAEAFGIGFELPPALQQLYLKFGNDLPATYGIDAQGRIQFAHLDADYRARAEPAEVLARLAS
jgi:peroxiredoxin